MTHLTRTILAMVLVVSLLGASADAGEKIRVVATTTDLKSLADAVGGDLVDVTAMARGSQNAHDLEIRPSLMVKVRQADLLVVNGLDLDQWAEVVVQGANNPKVIFGAPGRVDASQGLLVLEAPRARLDRSMGDVHPYGNPHYTLDPGATPAVTANILEGLTRVAPQYRTTFERNRQAFLARLEQAMTRWSTTLAPSKGAKVVVDHNMWIYFLTRFGLTQSGTIEERPGIPPAPGHLAKLIQLMKDEKVKVVLTAPWGDRKLADRVASEAGARTALMASAVEARKGTDTYIETVDHNVKMISQALQ